MDWMDANQLGRRNLSKEAHDLLLGRRYNRTKRANGGDRKSDESLAQNDPVISTAAKLATEHGVSEATVKRAGQFAEAVEAQGLEAEAMSGKLKGKKKEVVEAHRPKLTSSMETVNEQPAITIERAAELSGSTTASIKRAKSIVTTGIQDHHHLDGITGITGRPANGRGPRNLPKVEICRPMGHHEDEITGKSAHTLLTLLTPLFVHFGAFWCI